MFRRRSSILRLGSPVVAWRPVDLAAPVSEKLSRRPPIPSTFQNINRQVGASPTNRNCNKAEVVAEMVHDVTPDVDLEIYPLKA